jgi:hypothetical protein
MGAFKRSRAALGLVALGALLGFPAAASGTVSPLPRSDYSVKPVCANPSYKHAGCLAFQLVPVTAEARKRRHPLGIRRPTPLAAPSPREGAFGIRPQDLHTAYQLPTEALSAQTIALVDAYNDPTAETDLKAYDEEFSLPPCTTANGCFKQVNQKGETANLPFPKTTKELETFRKGTRSQKESAEEATGWGLEISLDIESAHATCQSCKIVLAEATVPSYEDLEAAERSATTLGATEISNSWAGPEAGETPELELASPFNHAGIVITASSGDDGYLNWDGEAALKGAVNFPSSSPHVVAVGGTRLTLGTGGTWSSEAVWNGDHATGGGCSTVFTAQPWQQSLSDWSAVGCSTKRAVADVSADADPYTGVAVHDTSPECEYVYEEAKVKHVLNWCTIGGTSLSSPVIASVFALAGGANGVAYPASTLYSRDLSAPESLHDVTSGSNGACSKPFLEGGLSACTATEEAEASCSSRAICLSRSGYDGPTGLGTPNGIAAFSTSVSSAPTVVTGSASGVSQTAATLKATVNPNGAEVTACKLEYGTSLPSETSVPCSPSPGSGTSPVAVTGTISGLTANTSYHFRVVAVNAGGGSTGATESFTTLPNAPTVSTGSATAVSQTGATLHATVNPNGGEVTSCYIEYGTSLPSAQHEGCNPSPGSGTSVVPVTASVIGLAANTSYHFRVVATNAGGTSTASAEGFTTLPNAPTVTPGSASGVSQTGATLKATVNPNGAEVTACKLEYGTSLPSEKSVPCNPAPGGGNSPVTITGTASGLTAGSTYHFRVVATNSGGTSTAPAEQFTTLPNAPTVTTGSATAVSQTGATLHATVNPNGGEVTSCYIEYGTSLPSALHEGCSPSPGSGTSAVNVTASIIGLTANSSYQFRVVATNAGGTSTGTPESVTTLPNKPTVTAGGATGVSQTEATLKGTVNPNGAEVTSCKLEYGTSLPSASSAPCTPGPGSGTSAVAVSAGVTGLTANSTYQYRVIATNAGGTTTGTAESFATLPNAPTVVTGSASTISQTGATVEATVNPNGGEVTSCTLEYGTSLPSANSVPCKPGPGSGAANVTVSAAISGLTANTSYQYRVNATNAGGTSNGTTHSLTTLPNAPGVSTGSASSVTQTGATIHGTVNPNGGEVTSCTLEYGTTLPSGSAVPCSPSPGSGNGLVSVSAAISGLTADTAFHYRVIATNAGGTSTGTTQTFTTLPNAPTVSTGSATGVTRTAATLQATVNPEDGEVTSCTLEYGTTLPSGSSVPCTPSPGSGTSPAGVSGAISGLSANTTYQYRVIATNAGGTGTGSIQSFTTLAAVQYGACVKTPLVEGHRSGFYDDKNCTVRDAKHEGKYEWTPTPEGAGIALAAKARNVTLKSALLTVACTRATAQGQITGPTTSTETIVFSSCTSSGSQCTSAGERAGSISTSRLDGSLMLPEAGAPWTRFATEAASIAVFECGGISYALRGSIAGVEGCDVEVMTPKSCLRFAGGEGEQALMLEILGGSSEPVTLTAGFKGRSPQKVEIRRP